jgi:hypothetical protein
LPSSGGNDPWLLIDVDNARHLRDALDRRNGARLPIIYPLAIPYASLRDRDEFSSIIAAVQRASPASLWKGFGSRSTATAAINFLEASNELHRLGIPVVADGVGGIIGLSLLAFGAVGGISHGVTFGEDREHWKKLRTKDDRFGLERRVYLPGVDLMLKPSQARALLEASPRSKATFGCRNPTLLSTRHRRYARQSCSALSLSTHLPNLRAQSHPRADQTTVFPRSARETGYRPSTRPPKTFARLPETRVARESTG